MKKIVLQITYGFFIRYFLKIVVGVSFPERKFLREVKQFIIIANHNSHLDTMTLMAAMPKSMIDKIKPVAAIDHFGKTKIQKGLSDFFINTLLIQRKRDKENPENDPIERMVAALDAGYSLILFPEGTRGEPEKLQKFKAGIALLLSKRREIPYIPAYLKGMGYAMPKGDNLIVPYKSSLKFGPPCVISTFEIPDIMEEIKLSFEAVKPDAEANEIMET